MPEREITIEKILTLPIRLLLAILLFAFPTLANLQDCSTLEEILTICNSLTPGFTTLSLTEQVPCYCYSSTAWNPDFYDGYWDGCLSYLKTENPAQLTSAGINPNSLPLDPCREVGDLSPCLEFDYLVSSCEAATPALKTNSNFDIAASCVCYSGLSWQPQTYDNILNSCRRYLKTYDSSFMTQPLETNNPCQTAGDVRATTTPIVANPTAPTAPAVGQTSSQPAPTGAAASSSGSLLSPSSTSINLNSLTTLSAYSACSTIIALNSICNAKTPGFSAIQDASVLASCLCYSGSTWAPQTYDGAFGHCASFLSVYDPPVYSSIKGAQLVLNTTPCQSVGNVAEATTTSHGSSSSSTSPTSRSISSTTSTTSSAKSSVSSSPNTGGRVKAHDAGHILVLAAVLIGMV